MRSVLNTLNEAKVLENNLKPDDEDPHIPQPSHMEAPPPPSPSPLGRFQANDRNEVDQNLLVLENVIIDS